MKLETFDMVDAVASLDLAGGRISVRARVPDASPVFDGHFPGHPIVPGVLLTEAMAQASGFLLLARSGYARMAFLMGVDRARFRAFVGPGTDLDVEAVLEHDGSGYAVTRCAITAAGARVAEAGLRLRTLPFPAGLEGEMRARARRIGLGAEAA